MNKKLTQYKLTQYTGAMIYFASLLVLTSYLYAEPIPKVRVFKKPDGSVFVLHVADKACRNGESMDACFERIATKDCPKGQDDKCLPYADIDKSSLPSSRENRSRWVFIDPNDLPKGLTIRTKNAEELEKEQDAETIATLEERLEADTITQEELKNLLRLRLKTEKIDIR